MKPEIVAAAIAGLRAAPLSLLGFVLVLIPGTGLAGPAPAGECVDVTRPQPLRIEGVLTHRIFPGPPNYEDIRQGDKPEPAYILHLQQSICASGDDFVDPKHQIDYIQIYPADADDPVLWRQLRKLVGKPVAVEGSAPFGAHTGHHHAPLIFPIKKVTLANRRR